jgi:hypothetical protein
MLLVNRQTGKIDELNSQLPADLAAGTPEEVDVVGQVSRSVKSHAVTLINPQGQPTGRDAPPASQGHIDVEILDPATGAVIDFRVGADGPIMPGSSRSQDRPVAYPNTEIINALAALPRKQSVPVQEFSAPEDGFSVRLPGRPEKQILPHPLGVNSNVYTLKTNSGTYSIVALQVPPGQTVTFEQMLKDKGIQSQANVPVEGGAGKEYELTAADPQGARFVSGRLFLVRGHVFQVSAAGPGCRLSNPAVRQFLDSFRLMVPARQPVGGDALVGYWAFEQEMRAVVVQDLSGRGNHGSNHQGRSVPGVKGNALAFDRNPGQRFDYGTSDDFNFDAGWDFTLTGWFQTAEQEGTILCQDNDGKDRPHGFVRIGVFNRALVAQVGDDSCPGEPQRLNLKGGPVHKDRPHHSALVRARGTVSLYQDGKLTDSGSNPFSNGPITTNVRTIGADWLQARQGVNLKRAGFQGAIDEVRIYQRALTPAEIQAQATHP